MVSYYNALSYSQKHSAANLAYPGGQPWQWTANYHTPPNHQFLGEMDTAHAHAHQMYYNPHMFHTAGSAASEWHSPTSSAENFSPQNIPNAHQMLQQHQHQANGIGGGSGGGAGTSGPSSAGSSGSSSASAGPGSTGNTQLNETASSIGDPHIAEGLPSPPITVSGSEISSPGAPASSSSPHHGAHHLHNNVGGGGGSGGGGVNHNNNNSPSATNNNTSHHNNNNNNSIVRQTSPVKSPYYDWMKKPSYPAQPTPGATYTDDELCTNAPTLQDFTDILDSSGKTRTKDKYRVVYTDFQRLELEKEYCTSRYITIRRKTELAQSLSLSERQVKIWFQNRRAKERKQNKKGNDPTSMSSIQQHNDYASLMDTKPKLEPGLHLQHSLHHSMSSMAAMSMPAALGLHPHHPHHLHGHHHPLAGVSAAHQHNAAAVAHHQSLHQSTHSQMSAAAAAAAASVGTLSM